MKKLLGLLATFSITASTSVLAVSCEYKSHLHEKKNIFLQRVKNAVSKNIQNLAGIDEVNAELAKNLNANKIDGVLSIKADMKNKSKTDVIVTVKIDKANYNLVGGSTFGIEKAIKDYSKNDIDVKLIQTKLLKDIQNLDSLDEFKNKLNDEISQLEGVISLDFCDFYNKIYTDLVVTVKINEEKYNLIGNSDIVINNALKKISIKTNEIQKIASENIQNLDNLEQVKNKLQNLLKAINNIQGVTFIDSFIVNLKDNSETDVVVKIILNENNANLIGDLNFEIFGAIHIQPKTFQPTIYLDENGKDISTNETDLFSIKTKEIKQIGFFKNKNGEIEAVKMPKMIEKVPSELPKEITNVNHMFYGTTLFNQDISNWDTSNVTNMKGMFQQAYLFNQNISNWDTSKVIDMSEMFEIANSFNQDISSWDTSNVTDMSYMFYVAKNFNQSLFNWNTSNVTNMESMFQQAHLFNQDISNWNTSNVTNMGSMFWNSISFNQDIKSWNVSNVMYMEFMFTNAYNFNQDISNWDVSKVLYHTKFSTGSALNKNYEPKWKK